MQQEQQQLPEAAASRPRRTNVGSDTRREPGKGAPMAPLAHDLGVAERGPAAASAAVEEAEEEEEEEEELLDGWERR